MGSHTLSSFVLQPPSLRCWKSRLEAAELSAVGFVPADACRGKRRLSWCTDVLHFSCEGGCRAALLAILRRRRFLLRPTSGRETWTAAAAAFAVGVFPSRPSCVQSSQPQQSISCCVACRWSTETSAREARHGTPSKHTEVLIRQAASFEANCSS